MDDRRLGDAVGRALGRADEAVRRRDIDDAARPPGRHPVAPGLLAQKERAAHVGRRSRSSQSAGVTSTARLRRLTPALLTSTSSRPNAASVVGQRLLDARLRAQVEDERHRARSGRGELRERVAQVLGARRRHGDVAARARQRQRGRGADPVGRPGHQRGFVSSIRPPCGESIA